MSLSDQEFISETPTGGGGGGGGGERETDRQTDRQTEEGQTVGEGKDRDRILPTAE